MRILLVEDDPDDTWLFKRFLSNEDSNVSLADTVVRLKSAIEKVRDGGIDLIVTDLTLPDCEGLDTFKHLKAEAPSTPIVVLSGNDDQSQAIEAVRLGAEDYLVKGHANAHDLSRAISYAIERTRRRRIENDLQVAGDIQLSLYPRGVFEVPGFDFTGRCYPAETVGGDYYDFVRMSDNRVGAVVGDVAGHGVGPALLMAETRACLATLTSMRALTWVSALAQTTECPGEILTGANTILTRNMPRNRFVTLLMVTIDTQNRILNHANAGHPPGYVIDRDGGTKAVLNSRGFPVGVDDEARYTPGTPVQLAHGDVIFLVSDGIIESMNKENEIFGADRVLDVLRDHRQASSEFIQDRLYEALATHRSDAPASDDVTSIVIRVE